MANKLHCVYCFDVLLLNLRKDRESLSHLRDLHEDHHPQAHHLPLYQFGEEKYPLFVTWKKQESGSYRLRGCIGTFSARELPTGLREYAITSAFNDSRFRPLHTHEVPLLACDVSLLTDFETAEHVEDWQVGVHGITIDLNVRGKLYSATYLPEVAVEQGWSKQRVLTELLAKAGSPYPFTPALAKNIKVTRYQSSKCSISWADYTRLKVALLQQLRIHPHFILIEEEEAHDPHRAARGGSFAGRHQHHQQPAPAVVAVQDKKQRQARR